MVPVVYFLGGVLVRAATKKIAQRLVAQGFRKATKGQISSKIKIVDGTENNLISLITRALAKIKGDKPKTPSGPAPRGANQKPVPQSRIGRKGPEKLSSYGPTGSLPKRVPKKPLSGPKSIPKSTTTSSGLAKLGRGTLIGANIMAGLGLAKVGYDAWKNRNGVTDIDVKDIKITRGEKETKAEFNNRLKKLLPKVAPSKPKPSPKVTKEYFGNRRPTGSGISSTTKKKIDETVRKVLIASRKKEGKK